MSHISHPDKSTPGDPPRGDKSPKQSVQPGAAQEPTTIDLGRESLPSNIAPTSSQPSVAEFRLVASYQDLVDLYANKGQSFNSPEDLFEQVKTDWTSEINRIDRQTPYNTLPQQFPSVTVETDGVRYNIFGCTHTSDVGEQYLQLLSDTAETRIWWAHEHTLGSYLPGLKITPVEIGDQYAQGIFSGVVNRHIAKFGQLKDRYFSRPKRLQYAKQVGASEVDLFLQRLSLPFDMLYDMPAQIDIIRRETFGLRYTSCQVRSAYQAAFLKAWQPQGVGVELEDQVEKNILVGALHAHEIEYFLKHEPKFKARLIEKAQREAELYNRDPEECFRRRRVKDYICELVDYSLYLGIGVGIGNIILKLI